MKEHETSEEETAVKIVGKDIKTGFEVVNALTKPILPPIGEIFVRHIGGPFYRRAMRALSR